MALTTLDSTEFVGVEYDPDIIDAETVIGLLRAGQERAVLGAEEEDEDLEDDVPPEVAAMLDNGASQDEAIKILQKAFMEDGFLQDDLGGLMGGTPTEEDGASLFEEAVAEIKATPTIGEADPAIASQIIEDAGPAIRLEVAGTEAGVFFGTNLAFTMPAKTAKANDLDKFVLFIQTILDTMNMFFALLGLGKAAQRKWAITLAKKLGKAQKWLKEATKAFGHFSKAYGIYKGFRDGGASRKKAAVNSADAFASAFLGFSGVIFKRCLKVVRAILALVCRNWREVTKICLKLLAALAQWVGTAGAKLAKALIDVVLSGFALWEDVEAWQKV